MSVKRDARRGTWYLVVDVAVANGKRHQLKRRGFATKKAAEAAEAVIVAEQARGTFVRPSRGTLEAFLVDEWLPAKVATLKPSTAASYRQMIRSYVVPRVGAVELAKVDGAHAERSVRRPVGGRPHGCLGTCWRAVGEVGAQRARASTPRGSGTPFAGVGWR